MTPLALRLKEALKLRKMTQRELASSIGVSGSSISQIMNGDTQELKAANALKIARALNVDPWWLVFGEGELEPQENGPLEEANQLLRSIPASNIFAVKEILKQLGSITKK